MNDYDFGKYYRSRNKSIDKKKSSSPKLDKIYKRISIAFALGLIIFFAGLMTGINFQENRISSQNIAVNMPQNKQNIVESADISPESLKNTSQSNESEITDSADTNREIRSTLIDPENAYIILAKRYSEDSKERALYYAGLLKKLVKDYNYDVIPSVRGKSIKIYVGPMKGKKNAEKMLARVKSIPEFTNSAILYKK